MFPPALVKVFICIAFVVMLIANILIAAPILEALLSDPDVALTVYVLWITGSGALFVKIAAHKWERLHGDEA